MSLQPDAFQTSTSSTGFPGSQPSGRAFLVLSLQTRTETIPLILLGLQVAECRSWDFSDSILYEPIPCNKSLSVQIYGLHFSEEPRLIQMPSEYKALFRLGFFVFFFLMEDRQRQVSVEIEPKYRCDFMFYRTRVQQMS